MKKLYLGFATIALLGACSHYSEDLSALEKTLGAPESVAAIDPANPETIDPAAGTVIQPQASLTDTLAREYYQLARYENDQAYDYKASKLYTEKAQLCTTGTVVTPARLSDFDIPAEKVNELSSARSALVTALKEQNTPENARTLAVAQTRFECWLERAEEAADMAHFQTCREEFEQTMAQLVAPAAGTTGEQFQVGFAPNSAELDSASIATLSAIASRLTAPGAPQTKIVLTGFSSALTDTLYAQRLIAARLEAVQKVLQEQGVSPAAMTHTVSAAAAQTQQQESGSSPVLPSNAAVLVSLVAPPEIAPVLATQD